MDIVKFNVNNILNAPQLTNNKDNTMLNAFRIQSNASIADFNMIDGISDEYQDDTGIDTAASLNVEHDSTNDLFQLPDTVLLLQFNGQDGGKEIIDDGNTGHVVTQNGTAQLTTAQKKFGSTSLLLDGNSDYLTIPDNIDFDFGTGDFTIETFIRLNSTGSFQYIYHKRDGSSTKELQFYVSNSDVIVLDTSDGTSTSVTGTTVLTTGIWYHVAAVRDNGTLRIFLDGVEENNTTGSTEDVSSSTTLRLGNNVADSGFFNGYFDDLRISNIARYTSNFTVPSSEHTSDTNTKLLLHMNTHDISGNDGDDEYHIPTFNGTAQLDTTNKKFGTASLFLDGDSDFLEIPDSPDWEITDFTDYTIDCWAKFNNLSDHANICSFFESGTNNDGWQLTKQVDNTIRFQLRSSDVTHVDLISNTNISDNNFHHIAVIKIGNDYGLYIDGNQVAYDTSTHTDNYSATLKLGRRPNTTDPQWMDGNIDEFRIQAFNYFNANPVSGLTDTITVPTSEYDFNIKLISDSFTAEAQPEEVRVLVLKEDIDSLALNTDLIVSISRDGGTTYTQATLEDEGTYEGNTGIVAATVDISAQPAGTSMKYKIETVNDKKVKLKAAGLSWT